MKKNIYYLGAIVATSLFTGCASDDSFDDGKYDKERGVVKTEFTISLPAKAAGGTRMTSAIVQAGEDQASFRGIQDIKLYPFNSKVAGITGTTTIPSVITLTRGTTTAKVGASGTVDNQIANAGALFAGNNAHLYQDIEIAVGTKAFMFYGLAIPAAGSDHFQNGTLTDNLGTGTATALADITFSPSQIYGGNLGDNATAIVTYLNSIAAATGWSDQIQAGGSVILGTLYSQFISMQAGSWASVKGAVQQLYSSLYTRNDAVSTAVKAAILANANVSDSEPDGTLEFTANAFGNFPADIDLPDGAIYMLWNPTSKTFEMITGSRDNTGMNITALNKYVYPAPLYYRALSDIRTADVSKLTYYDDASTDHKTTWAGVIEQYGTYQADVNDVVKFTTRSIALVDQIQYAVGRLDVKVKAGAATLADNRAALSDYSTDENINLYTLADPANPSSDKTFDKFPVTGILVGN